MSIVTYINDKFTLTRMTYMNESVGLVSRVTCGNKWKKYVNESIINVYLRNVCTCFVTELIARSISVSCMDQHLATIHRFGEAAS